MKKSIYSSRVNGTIHSVSSKSMAQRALALASISNSNCTLKGITRSDDVDAAIQAARSIGSAVEEGDGTIIVSPKSTEYHHMINCGEAGLTVRMFAPIAALFTERFSFNGRGSLLKRPVTMVEEALKQLNVHCSTNDGYLPMTIEGPINGGTVKIDGAVSSQLLTGLLIALPKAEKDSTIEVINLKSTPYIDMTLNIVKDFGVEIINNDYTKFIIKGNQSYDRTDYIVEGDWSSASFLLVAAALTGEVTIENLNASSFQADRIICDILNDCGADLHLSENKIYAGRSNLKPFTFDATNSPDLFPPLVALASGISGKSIIGGSHRLLHKESNRKETLINEFSKIGVTIYSEGDTLVVEGGTVQGGDADACNDHRIAMALGITGLISESGIMIEGAEAVEKSYPHFFEDMKKLGADVS
jgi:3-phosphoshikimate 1-carboxyvinyltransferase